MVGSTRHVLAIARVIVGRPIVGGHLPPSLGLTLQR